MIGKKLKIGFIGGGNMGEALLAGLISKKIFSPSQIGVSDPDRARLRRLSRLYKIDCPTSNVDLVRRSETVLLAVKPQQMGEILDEIRPNVTPRHLFVSIAAGLDTAYFLSRLPNKTRLIRVMPNLASLIGEGAAALFATKNAKPADKSAAKRIFSASGKAVFVDREELLDTVTAVSGSGPAFVFSFADALIEAGAARGLPRPLGRELVVQTLLGTTRLLEKSKDPIADMIARVASKGGTTEAGLKVFSDLDFSKLIDRTIGAATDRAAELRRTSEARG